MSRSERVKRVLLVSAFALYVFVLAYLALYRNRIYVFNGVWTPLRSVNLVPFKGILEYIMVYFGWRVMDVNLLGNIVIFIPMGLYLRVFQADKKWTVTFLWVLAATVAIECIQFIFGLGASDIDDVILNSLGGLIGIFIYHAISRLFKEKKKVYTVLSTVSVLGAFILLLALNRIV